MALMQHTCFAQYHNRSRLDESGIGDIKVFRAVGRTGASQPDVTSNLYITFKNCGTSTSAKHTSPSRGIARTRYTKAAASAIAPNTSTYNTLTSFVLSKDTSRKPEALDSSAFSTRTRHARAAFSVESANTRDVLSCMSDSINTNDQGIFFGEMQVNIEVVSYWHDLSPFIRTS